MLKLMWGSDPGRAKLVLQKSSHPARIAREYGSETGVLDSVAMSRALAKMVKSVSEHNTVSHQQDSGDEYLLASMTNEGHQVVAGILKEIMNNNSSALKEFAREVARIIDNPTLVELAELRDCAAAAAATMRMAARGSTQC